MLEAKELLQRSDSNLRKLCTARSWLLPEQLGDRQENCGALKPKTNSKAAQWPKQSISCCGRESGGGLEQPLTSLHFFSKRCLFWPLISTEAVCYVLSCLRCRAWKRDEGCCRLCLFDPAPLLAHNLWTYCLLSTFYAAFSEVAYSFSYEAGLWLCNLL